MRRIFYLLPVATSVILYSCNTEDTASETETEAVVEEQQFVAKKLGKEALSNAPALAWKDFHIDFTELFTYATPEEASKEIKKTLKNIQTDIEEEISEYPDSNAIVFRFGLEKGVGRLYEFHYINTETDKVLKSIINDGKNNLKEKATVVGSISQLGLKQDSTGWYTVDTDNTNLSDYKQFEVITDVHSIKVFAAK